MPSQRVEALLAGRTPDRLPWLPELNAGFIRKTTGAPEPRGAASPEAVADLPEDRQAGSPGDDDEGDHLEREARCAEIIGADII